MTDKRPQTIQCFLPQGEPRGIRIAEITTRIVQAVYVPRNKLASGPSCATSASTCSVAAGASWQANGPDPAGTPADASAPLGANMPP